MFAYVMQFHWQHIKPYLHGTFNLIFLLINIKINYISIDALNRDDIIPSH